MNKKKPYSIGIAGLKNGKHQFELELSRELLDLFESELMENISGSAILQLAKSETAIEAEITLDAKVMLLSDRSLREYEETMNSHQKVFFKFSDHFEMLEDDLFKIPFNEASLDFSQIIYDQIALSLPTKRLHPDEVEEEDLFYTTASEEELLEEEDNEDQEDEEKASDPRWDILKKLK